MFRSSYSRKKNLENAFRNLKLGAKKEIQGEKEVWGGREFFQCLGLELTLDQAFRGEGAGSNC
jgi:hypothetical protein